MVRGDDYQDNNIGYVKDNTTFGVLRGKFETQEKVSKDGLGPVYNAISCVDCHQNPVTGSGSQVTVLRAGHHLNKKPYFEEPPGGSLIFQRAIDPAMQVRIPEGFEVHTLRLATNILGDGLVECIPDDAIYKVQADQYLNHREMVGTILMVPTLVSLLRIEPVPTVPKPRAMDPKVHFIFNVKERVGRFGWKCADASLLNFAAGAYFNEMGITSPVHDTENTSGGKDVSQSDGGDKHPNDGAEPDTVEPKPGNEAMLTNPFGEDVLKFTNYMRSTKAHPPDTSGAPAVLAKGLEVFNRINCAVCHVPKWTTGDATVELSDFAVTSNGNDLHPEALSHKSFSPYSDFMLHDIGSGDGIVQTQHAVKPIRIAKEAMKKSADLEAMTAEKPELAKNFVFRAIDDIDGSQPVNGAEPPRLVFKHIVNTAYMIRTAPLWGLRTRPQLMHDGLSMSVTEAILRHGNQAHSARTDFQRLSDEDRAALLAFLSSL